MAVTYNGTTLADFSYNTTPPNRITYNGTTVWQRDASSQFWESGTEANSCINYYGGSAISGIRNSTTDYEIHWPVSEAPLTRTFEGMTSTITYNGCAYVCGEIVMETEDSDGCVDCSLICCFCCPVTVTETSNPTTWYYNCEAMEMLFPAVMDTSGVKTGNLPDASRGWTMCYCQSIQVDPLPGCMDAAIQSVIDDMKQGIDWVPEYTYCHGICCWSCSQSINWDFSAIICYRANSGNYYARKWCTNCTCNFTGWPSIICFRGDCGSWSKV